MNPLMYMKDREFSKGRKYIGASDMDTLAGINQHKTPLELWEELTGRAKGFSGNKKTAWGHKQEPMILGEYIKKVTGSSEARNEFITSRLWGDVKYEKFHSWTESFPKGQTRRCAHADLLDLSGETPVIIQAKNTGAYAAAARKRDPDKGYDKEDFTANGIPLSVYFQEQWEMFCYGITSAYVAVLIDGWDWQFYGPINYDKNTLEKLYALSEKMLWHVDKDIMPEPKTWSDIVKYYPNYKPNTKAVVSDDSDLECRAMIEQYGKIQRKIKGLEDKKDDIKNALGLYIGENNYLETPDGFSIASVSAIPGKKSISVSGLAKFPDIYKKCDEAGLIKKGDDYRQIYIKSVAAGNIDKYTLLTTDDGEKWKKSRKKYSYEEKKNSSALLKSLKIQCKWEKV